MEDDKTQSTRNYRTANIALDVAELVDAYCKRFERDHNVALSFSAACVKLIRERLAEMMIDADIAKGK